MCGWHSGVDFAAPAGTPVYAVISGTIRHRSYGAGFGRYQFAISPSPGQPFADGESFYAHTRSRLPDGTEVVAGQKVAEVGYEGNVQPPGPAGAHLHLEYHTAKSIRPCSVIKNPQPLLDWQPSAPGWRFPPGHKVYAKYLKYGGHEQNADKTSDSIKALQEVLNRHKMPGGANLPVTGKYLGQTDQEVRLCQSLHLPPADAAGRSFVGPKQWAHLAAATGCLYVYVA